MKHKHMLTKPMQHSPLIRAPVPKHECRGCGRVQSMQAEGWTQSGTDACRQPTHPPVLVVVSKLHALQLVTCLLRTHSSTHTSTTCKSQ
jgi:hypothetical protein